MNYVGNPYAPMPVQVSAQPVSQHPQLMSTPWSWNPGFMGSLCNLETKNRFSGLAVEDYDRDDPDEHEEFPKLSNSNQIEQRRKPPRGRKLSKGHKAKTVSIENIDEVIEIMREKDEMMKAESTKQVLLD